MKNDNVEILARMRGLPAKPGNAEGDSVNAEEMPTITISFGKNGCFAQKTFSSGNTAPMDVNEAIREFDKFAAKEA